jgi:hypothetical protein
MSRGIGKAVSAGRCNLRPVPPVLSRAMALHPSQTAFTAFCEVTMSHVAEHPLAPAADTARLPASMPVRGDHLKAGPYFSLAGGGALLTYGLWRRSWLGLTAAALGGLLVYRAFNRATRRPDVPPPESVMPPPEANPSIRVGRPFAAAAGLIDPEAGHAPKIALAAVPPSAAVAVASTGDEELTPDEFARAQLVAYFHALHRGGGRLPAYDHDQAVADFCRAAGEIRGGRSRDTSASTGR